MTRGKDIERLIPQRAPMLMVDEFEAVGANAADTALYVRSGNLFLLPDGTLAETGLIEHIAQSAAALAGYQPDGAAADSAQGAGSQPRIGLIGEVKHFECHRRPAAGEKVLTHLEFGMSFGNVTLATGECRVEGETIAQAKLKIFMQ